MKLITSLSLLILLSLGSNAQDYNLITANHKMGILNSKGDTILNPLYDDVKWVPYFPEILFVKRSDKWALFNSEGKKLTSFEYDNMAYISNLNRRINPDSTAVFAKEYGNWAKMDKKGKLQTWYTYQQQFSQDEIIIDGWMIIEIDTKAMEEDRKVYFASQKNQGQENNTKKIFYTYSKATLDGIKKGLINPSNDTLTKAKYDEFWGNGDNGYFTVKNNEKFGLVDTLGKIAIDCLYDDIRLASDKRSFVRKGNKWALANNYNKLLTGFIYDDVDNSFSDGTAKVTNNKKIGFINMDGKQIIPYQFNNATSFVNGFAIVYFDKKVSLNLGEGYRTIGGITYDLGNINMDHTDQIPVLINKSGKAIYKGTGYESFDFTTSEWHTIIAKRNANDIVIDELIDTAGRIILPFEKNSLITLISNSYYIFSDYNNNSLYGVKSYSGKILLKPIFYYITDFVFNGNSLAKAYLDFNNYFYVNKNFQCTSFDDIFCPDKE